MNSPEKNTVSLVLGSGGARGLAHIGVIQVLLTAPGGLVEQVPKDLARLAARLRRSVPATEDAAEVAS